MLAFSIDYYGMIFRATQSVELFCAYDTLAPDSARVFISYSTVTLFARFLGLSTSNPLATLT